MIVGILKILILSTFILMPLTLMVIALTQIAKCKLPISTKILWVVIVIFCWLLGSLLWLVIKPHKKRCTDGMHRKIMDIK